MPKNHATYSLSDVYKSLCFNRLAKSWSTQSFALVHSIEHILALLSGGYTCLFTNKCMKNCHMSSPVHSPLEGNIG